MSWLNPWNIYIPIEGEEYRCIENTYQNAVIFYSSILGSPWAAFN